MTVTTEPDVGEGSSFDIIASYTSHLQSSASIPMPIASIFALCDLIKTVPSNTTSELITLIDTHSTLLKLSLTNPVPATAGLDLFARLVITMQWDASGDFELQKKKLVDLAREYAERTVPSCREKIVNMAKPFIRDDAIILTHSYSRVVMKILLAAAAQGGNSISVYVTESRPGGLGLKTYDELTAAGIPTTVICDSAAAYVGEKIDFVLVGAEGVCESGGILNAVGTLGLALVAKAYGKPFYAAAER
jgi:translation initiation factor eIF-2B subunit alpha